MAGHAYSVVHYGWDIAARDRYMSNTITSSQAFLEVETQCRIYCTKPIDLLIRNNYLLNIYIENTIENMSKNIYYRIII